MFRNLQAVKDLFHDVAINLVKKVVIKEKIDVTKMEKGKLVKILNQEQVYIPSAIL